MGEPNIYCPLCCNDTFDSKQALFEHLLNVSSNLNCPICTEKFETLEQLLAHLKRDYCKLVNSNQITVFEHSSQIGMNEGSLEKKNLKLEQNVDSQENDIERQISSFDTTKMNNNQIPEVGKMYVELLSKQLMKPCLQTQELKLVKEDGESRYVILTTEESVLDSGMAIVTKQNNDGTISLTTLKDSESMSNADNRTDSEDNVTLETSQEAGSDRNQEEFYSCNTCGVSFSSVLEHIQNYHNDQEVVVEEPMDENNTIPIEFEPVPNEETPDKQTSRRMITDNGDIIEEPLIEEDASEAQREPVKFVIPLKEDTQGKQGRVYTRRYVRTDKLSSNVVKDIKPTEEKNGPYHKVVIKELLTTKGEKIKVYNCMSCNIYVSTLAEFNQHPCKVLKYPCSQCPVAYENSKSLCAHMKVHKTKMELVSGATYIIPDKFECEICSTVFSTSKSLKLHKRMHDPIKSRPIEPPIETPEGTAASEDKFLCSVCDKLIPMDYRTIHQNSHKTSNKMNCDICNKKFHSREYLDMHMSVHNLDKVIVGKQDKSLPYTCLYCNRKFARPHEKVKHERIHTGEKPHACEICGKAFRVSYCLTLHMRTHTGARPYACPHCDKRFKAHSVYNHHLLTHSEVRAYKCPFCPKAFKTSVQLAGHKNSHTKPFSCQQCNRPFASLYAVRVHMEVHSRQNSLKFACKRCGASYARAFALNDHVRQAHCAPDHAPDHAPDQEKIKEDWMVQDNADLDSDGMNEMKLNKELPQEINELGMSSNELIVP